MKTLKSIFVLVLSSLLMLTSCEKSEDSSVETDSRAVDLGLSVQWASCNLGADSPEDYGYYLAWAEISEKSTYSWENYEYSKDSHSVFDLQLTKYNEKSVFLENTDDAANVLWGNGWRIPTKAELQELVDKCTWSISTSGGRQGYMVKGPSGNSIFLPFAGLKDEEGLHERGNMGFYWSSQTYEYYEGAAEELTISEDDNFIVYAYRNCGLTIRPVR